MLGGEQMKLLIILCIMIGSFLYAGGNPEYLYLDDGSVIGYELDGSASIKPMSSYQRLKRKYLNMENKYILEVSYNDELTNRMDNYIGAMEVLEKEYEKCILSQEEDTNNDLGIILMMLATFWFGTNF